MLKRTKSSENYLEILATRYKTAISSLNEFSKDSAFAKHRKTFDEIGKALSKLIENDYKWSVKCKKLEDELADNEIKVKTTLQLSDEDKQALDTFKKELQNSWNLIDELKKQKDESSGLCSMCNAAVEICTEENDKTFVTLEEEKYKLLDEIEKGKLQVFELEEELANKDRSLEELTNSLKSKEDAMKMMEAQLSQVEERTLKENSVLKLVEKTNAGAVDTTQSKLFSLRKKQLQDANKRIQLSDEKLKHLVKKNNNLNRQFQKAKGYANLLKVQLASQNKMLNLLSSQYCKFEEKDQKQVRIINELEAARNKLIHTTGHLESEAHELRKKLQVSHFQRLGLV